MAMKRPEGVQVPQSLPCRPVPLLELPLGAWPVHHCKISASLYSLRLSFSDLQGKENQDWNLLCRKMSKFMVSESG